MGLVFFLCHNGCCEMRLLFRFEPVAVNLSLFPSAGSCGEMMDTHRLIRAHNNQNECLHLFFSVCHPADHGPDNLYQVSSAYY